MNEIIRLKEIKHKMKINSLFVKVISAKKLFDLGFQEDGVDVLFPICPPETTKWSRCYI